jgi:acyl carrier protein
MIVSEYAPVKIGRLSPSTTFVSDLGLDDLEPEEIVMAMEDEFRIKIADKDVENLLSISEVISYIILRVGNENGA